MRNVWGDKIVLLALVGGLCLADYGLEGAPTAAAQRFTVLAAFNNEAVRDNETGLVWEKSPSSAALTWDEAHGSCMAKNISGKRAWRLPSSLELASLLDHSVAAPGPALPPDHPFRNVRSSYYWSATTDFNSPSSTWLGAFSEGNVGGDVKNGRYPAWCVRDPMKNADQY
jgi:hypothetical protein